jgi:hypothetical protein
LFFGSDPPQEGLPQEGSGGREAIPPDPEVVVGVDLAQEGEDSTVMYPSQPLVWRQRSDGQWVNSSAIDLTGNSPYFETAPPARCVQCGEPINPNTTQPRNVRNGFCSSGCAVIAAERRRARLRSSSADAPRPHLRMTRTLERSEVLASLTFVSTGTPGLGPQLWVGGPRAHAPSKDSFNKVENDEGFGVKPKGGLWTSTFVPEQGSAWTEWCNAEDFNVPQAGWASWLLYPTGTAQILRIDTYEDLKLIVESEYGLPVPYRQDLGARAMNFAKLATRFDAIYLTEEGQWATRLSHPHSLYGWDVSSVCWLQATGIDWDKSQYLGIVRWGQPPEPAVKPRRLRGPRRRF